MDGYGICMGDQPSSVQTLGLEYLFGQRSRRFEVLGAQKIVGCAELLFVHAWPELAKHLFQGTHDLGRDVAECGRELLCVNLQTVLMPSKMKIGAT